MDAAELLLDEPVDDRRQLKSREQILKFALAGNATLTIVSKKTGTRFTYKIKTPKRDEGDARPPIWFVSVLTGQDNEGDFTYLGNIRGNETYDHGFKSRIGRDAPSAQAFEWFWRQLGIVDEFNERELFHSKLEVWHEGRCGKCGRKPESIESGLGPVCAGGF